ncbi:MAG: GTPase family protein [Granulosicoccus sp.]
MKLSKLFNLTNRSAALYVALVAMLPMATLSVLGLIYLSSNELLLVVVLGWLAVTSVAYVVFILLPEKRRLKQIENLNADEESSLPLPELLTPKSDWTDQDKAVWSEGCALIQNMLQTRTPWEEIPDQSLRLLSLTSMRYSGETKTSNNDDASLKYRFTLPEALLVLSVTAHRYRKFVLANVPYAERVKLSSLLSLYAHKDNLQSGLTWANHARRLVRLSNPIAAAVGEIKDQFTDRLFKHLSSNVQNDLKRLLLQEVLQVAIDLYSGKLKASDEELEHYRSTAHSEDQKRPPISKEPLRVLLLGQNSAGKSSLINAMANSLASEVDTLPSTAQTQSHAIELMPGTKMHFIDTVGLNNTTVDIHALTELAFDADLIVFVARATQPARAPDQLLYEHINKAFLKKPERRTPPIMLVLTHVDQLTPRSEWRPPYDLGESGGKSQQISEALHSCLSQIGLPEGTAAIPVRLTPAEDIYNLDAVTSQIMSLQDTATMSQWNRRRVERGEASISWNERWSQIKGLGRVIGKTKIL